MVETSLHSDMHRMMEVRATLPVAETLAEERRNWTRYSSALAEPVPSHIAVEDIAFPTDVRDIPVRVYRPESTDRGSPCLIYLHGGGFMKGDLDSSDSIAWGFADQADAVVVSVDYRLTPEHPFPAAFDDTYAVLEYVHANSDGLGIDRSRIGLAGDSAGGNLAAATCLASRDRGGPGIVCQALIYPGTGLDQSSGSYLEHATSPGLTTEGTRRYREMYLPDDPESTNPYARPVLAPDHSDLPNAWVHSAEIDPIRDDGRNYAAKLALAGTNVSYREAKGMVHGFMRARFVNTDPDSGAHREFEAITRFLKRELYRQDR